MSQNARGVNGEELSGADVCDSYSKMGHWSPTEWPLLTGNHPRHAHDVTYFNVIFNMYKCSRGNMKMWAREAAERRQLQSARSVASLQPKTGKTREGSLRCRFWIPARHQAAPRLTATIWRFKDKTNKSKMKSLEIDNSINVFRYL